MAQQQAGKTAQAKAPQSGDATVTVNETTCQEDPKAQEGAEDQEEEPPDAGTMAAMTVGGTTTEDMEATPMTTPTARSPVKLPRSTCTS